MFLIMHQCTALMMYTRKPIIIVIPHAESHVYVQNRLDHSLLKINIYNLFFKKTAH